MAESMCVSSVAACIEDGDLNDRLHGSLRGWTMRKGHRKRLACVDDKESNEAEPGTRGMWADSTCQESTARAKLRDGSIERASAAAMSLSSTFERMAVMPLDFEWYEYESEYYYHFQEEVEEELRAQQDALESWSWSSSSSSCWSDADDEEMKQLCFKHPTDTRRKASRWEQAAAAAEKAATEYEKSLPSPADLRKSREAKTAVKVLEDVVEVEPCPVVGQRLSSAPAMPRPDVPFGPAPEERGMHDEVLSYAGPSTWVRTSCSKEAPTASNVLVPVKRGSDEYTSVTEYFRQTLRTSGSVEVGTLSRIQNAAVYGRFLRGGDETIMFHGCRSIANEDSILADGFKIACCTSRGIDFGTWLAYGAHYSNSGFAFDDRQGWRHLFVCVASYHHTVLDNATMRVVGQDCAYPQWLLTYKIHLPPPPKVVVPAISPAVAAGIRRPGRTRGPSAGDPFYVVQNGEWVLESVAMKR
eukprot:CAMPEP_0178402832 /NCGR_PEP_ID=MMETSP0689_2-20121128/17054_1 /TAXON_ID=160604 /ORGANISM="Amphidinium massartii, Strain CS-259" /LENGTH=470 /DNA_ID=CAMNT_0020023763 /DNA_START=83 /DNA_END=1495 /DNA_ORIENTATION=+